MDIGANQLQIALREIKSCLTYTIAFASAPASRSLVTSSGFWLNQAAYISGVKLLYMSRALMSAPASKSVVGRICAGHRERLSLPEGSDGYAQPRKLTISIKTSLVA